MTYESKTNKPVRSLEQSAQYQANYLKYDLKEDLKVLHPYLKRWSMLQRT